MLTQNQPEISLRPDRKLVILVTGASSGIGRACAEHLNRNGHRVYGTSRKPETDPGFNLIQMDVTDCDSVKAAVQHILENESRIDAVINNAGFGIAGAIETTSIDEVISQFNANFYGVHRVCQAVLPIMREQSGGIIINISSLGGLIGLPFQGLYSASKYALEGYSEALYKEVLRFGIRIVLVEPGDFATSFTKNRRLSDSSATHPVYGDQFAKTLKVIEADENGGADPIKIAGLMEKILRNPKPRLRYKVGGFSQTISTELKKIMPDRWFDRLIMNHYKLDNN